VNEGTAAQGDGCSCHTMITAAIDTRISSDRDGTRCHRGLSCYPPTEIAAHLPSLDSSSITVSGESSRKSR